MDSLEFFAVQTDAGLDKKVPIEQPEIVSEDELEEENFHKMAGLAVEAMPVSIMKALVQEIGRENLPVFTRAAEMAYEENFYKFNERDFEDLKSVDVFASTAEYLAIDLLEKDHRAWDYFNKAKNLLFGHPDMSGHEKSLNKKNLEGLEISGHKPDISKASSLAVQAMPVNLMQGLVHMIGQDKVPVFQKACELAYQDGTYGEVGGDQVIGIGRVAENLAFDMLHANRRGLQYFEQALDMFGKGEQKETSLQDVTESSLQSLAYRTNPENLTGEEFIKVAKHGQKWRVKFKFVYDMIFDKYYYGLIYFGHWVNVDGGGISEGDDHICRSVDSIISATLLEDVVESSLKSLAYRNNPENLTGEEFRQVVKVGQRWRLRIVDEFEVVIASIHDTGVKFFYWKNLKPTSPTATGTSSSIVSFQDISYATLLDDVVEGRLSTFADLYFNELFTVVPKKHDEKLGVLPDDQGFSKKYVFVWSSVRDLIHFKDDKWKKVSFKLPKRGKQDLLTPLVGGAYALSSINSQWHLEEKKGIALYE